MTVRVKQVHKLAVKRTYKYMHIARVNMVTCFIIFVRNLGGDDVSVYFPILQIQAILFLVAVATALLRCGFLSCFKVVGFTGGLPLIKHNDCIFSPLSMYVCM